MIIENCEKDFLLLYMVIRVSKGQFSKRALLYCTKLMPISHFLSILDDRILEKLYKGFLQNTFVTP
jgi:hypothetical protein